MKVYVYNLYKPVVYLSMVSSASCCTNNAFKGLCTYSTLGKRLRIGADQKFKLGEASNSVVCKNLLKKAYLITMIKKVTTYRHVKGSTSLIGNMYRPVCVQVQSMLVFPHARNQRISVGFPRTTLCLDFLPP